MPPLYDLGPGDRAVVALPGSTDPEVAEFLEDLGVRPGVELRIVDKQPFGGPMIVSVGGHERMLGENLARLILVHRVQEQLTGAVPLPQGSVTAQPRAGEASFIQQSETKRKDPSEDAIRR